MEEFYFKNDTKKEEFRTDDVVKAWNYFSNCSCDDLTFIQTFEELGRDMPAYDNDVIGIILASSLAYTVNQLRRENEALKQQVTDLEDEIEELK